MVEQRMAVPSVILLTTFHLEKDGSADLRKLVESVSSAKRDGEIARLRHIVLVQGCGGVDLIELKRALPQWVDVLAVEKRLSSPLARNRMIHHLTERDDFDGEAIVGFPDDDAWYPTGALACIAGTLENSPELGLRMSH